MKNTTTKKPAVTAAEKASAKILMEKMGLTRKEFDEISLKYGVHASTLLERMQLSKYQFIYTENREGRCFPCSQPIINGNLIRL